MSYHASPMDYNIHLHSISLHNQEPTSPSSPRSDNSSIRRRRKETCSSRSRVSKACERCRVRKVKCDGGKPCVRCIEVDEICDYTRRSRNRDTKEYSQSYVDQLLDQNSKYKTAMRVLYANRRLSIHPDDMKLPSTEGNNVPLVHDILDRLGLLQDGESAKEESEVADVQWPPELQRRDTHSGSLESVGWASTFDFGSKITLKGPDAASSTANTEFNNYNMDFSNSSNNLTNTFFDPSSMPNFGMYVKDQGLDLDVGQNVSFEDLEAVGSLMNQNHFMEAMLPQQDMIPASMFEAWS